MGFVAWMRAQIRPYRKAFTMNDLPDILETTEAERQATGYIFTEGPLCIPTGFIISTIFGLVHCTG